MNFYKISFFTLSALAVCGTLNAQDLRGVGSLALGYAAGPLPQPKERKAGYIHKV